MVIRMMLRLLPSFALVAIVGNPQSNLPFLLILARDLLRGPPWCCGASGAAIHISANTVYHERTKHLDIDCHFVRDKLKTGFVLPQHISTHQQLVDLFTKLLSGSRFKSLTGKLGMVSHFPCTT
ncbi:cysteine-rich RLK (RECEPTOR-like protein kinase) 8 [Striga hermonthica]|uniref:Cysteine-rich RLK (RECEPTOR-like protein kinase) 8 n=1 Tax=Striga hermonthica TaxID=68872 RepID=A0A9N7MJX2_STRHE|nr:cysteine-rich RLK (RECEPTOR-like protein kinase) 8 [Striga hermonthica]